ncbi:hypothetical protein SCH4B_1118 [Ruegeria sp. TrichCH4B]|nr:hypothetical protein SCH4B_1118 [Ruegeria sp. TrichCH4B]
MVFAKATGSTRRHLALLYDRVQETRSQNSSARLTGFEN